MPTSSERVDHDDRQRAPDQGAELGGACRVVRGRRRQAEVAQGHDQRRPEDHGGELASALGPEDAGEDHGGHRLQQLDEDGRGEAAGERPGGVGGLGVGDLDGIDLLGEQRRDRHLGAADRSPLHASRASAVEEGRELLEHRR